MTTIITISQLLIFFGYVYFIYRRYGKLTSISASTYKLQGVEKWYFLLFLGSVGTLNFFQEMGGLGFFAGAFLWFAGITINHGEKSAYSNIVHSVGTIGSIVLTYIGLWILYGFWIPSVLLGLSILLLYKDKYFIWWIEIIAMAIAMAAYLFR